MSIELSCSGCGKQLRVPDDSAGKQARCPACGEISQVPLPPLEHEAAPDLSDNPFRDAPAPSAPVSENPYQSPLVPSPPIRRSGPSAHAMLAPRSTRFFGAILDTLITLAGGLPGGVVFFATIENDDEAITSLGMALMFGGVLIVSIINWVMISQRGQSIAKRILKMRIIVRDTGDLPGFLRGVLLRIWVPAAINQACSFFSLVDALFIFSDEKRCLHDLIAGTVVVDVAHEQVFDGTRASYSPPGAALRRLPGKIALATCPQCGGAVPSAAAGRCPSCGAPLA